MKSHDIPDEAPQTLATRLQEALKRKNSTQTQLAKVLGRDHSTVSLYCSGKSTPKPHDGELIEALAKFLDIPSQAVLDLINSAALPSQSHAGKMARLRSVKELDDQTASDISGRLEALRDRGDASEFIERLQERGFTTDGDLLKQYLSGRKSPRIRALRQTALNPTLRGVSPHQLLVEYRQLFGRDLDARDMVRSVCKSLDGEFAQSGQEALSMTTFEGCVSQALGPNVQSSASQQHSRALLELLARIGYVDRLSPHRVVRRWRLNASHVINSLFGIDIQVPGLNFLLDGGLLLPAMHGLSILINGKPGTGKTLLSLQFAASLASSGFVVIFLAAEENQEGLLDKLSFAGYRSVPGDSHWLEKGESQFQLFTDRSAITAPYDLNLGVSPIGGSLILLNVQDRPGLFSPTSSLLTTIRSLSTSIKTSHGRIGLVLDSLDAVVNSRVDNARQRRNIENIFALSRTYSDVAVFTTELHEAKQIPTIPEYLTDLNILLSYREGVFPERVMEISKARTQSHIRGLHGYGIHVNDGIHVYPSIQSHLSLLRRRIRTPASSRRSIWSLDKLCLDELFSGGAVTGGILLGGNSQATNLILGLSFLASGLLTDQLDALLITVQQEPSDIAKSVRNYDQLGSLMPPDSQLGADWNNRVKVLHTPPDYFSAARFYDWVRTTLKRSEKGIGRVVLNSVDQLELASPLFSAEPLFLAGLVELFKSEGVSPLFISSHKGHQIERAFNTVIDAHVSDHANSRVISLSVSDGDFGALSQPRGEIVHKVSNGRSWLELKRLETSG